MYGSSAHDARKPTPFDEHGSLSLTRVGERTKDGS
jgi:hypothetical protein